MICTIDACALVLWANERTDEQILARLDHLLERLGKASGVLVLPTPAVSELLVETRHGTEAWLKALQKRSSVRVAPFDMRAAMECAMIHKKAVDAGGKRQGTKPGEAYQKVKVDRQIAAIAKVAGSSLVVTNDDDLIAVSRFIGIEAKRPSELELPDSAAQTKLDFQQETVIDAIPVKASPSTDGQIIPLRSISSQGGAEDKPSA